MGNHVTIRWRHDSGAQNHWFSIGFIRFWKESGIPDSFAGIPDTFKGLFFVRISRFVMGNYVANECRHYRGAQNHWISICLNKVLNGSGFPHSFAGIPDPLKWLFFRRFAKVFASRPCHGSMAGRPRRSESLNFHWFYKVVNESGFSDSSAGISDSFKWLFSLGFSRFLMRGHVMIRWRDARVAQNHPFGFSIGFIRVWRNQGFLIPSVGCLRDWVEFL